MKTLILIPLAVAVALAAAAGLCKMAGMTPHGRDFFTAAVIAVCAGELALLPAFALRRAEPSTLAHAALGGTVLHLLLTILLATAVMVARVVEPGTTFVFWLTGAYWVSLAGLVWALIRIVPHAPAKAK